MSTLTLSTIEQIAQDIENWGEGWFFAWNPDDHGRRARITRNHDSASTIRIDIEIHQEQRAHFVYAGCTVRGTDGYWTPVSVSVRNPITRKALDHINQRLDELDPPPADVPRPDAAGEEGS